MATDDNKDFGFSEKQRARFLEHGYLRLGHVLTETELSALQQRIDEIMMEAKKVWNAMDRCYVSHTQYVPGKIRKLTGETVILLKNALKEGGPTDDWC